MRSSSMFIFNQFCDWPKVGLPRRVCGYYVVLRLLLFAFLLENHTAADPIAWTSSTWCQVDVGYTEYSKSTYGRGKWTDNHLLSPWLPYCLYPPTGRRICGCQAVTIELSLVMAHSGVLAGKLTWRKRDRPPYWEFCLSWGTLQL